MADRQWFASGIQIFEEGEGEYFVGGVQINEDQATSATTAAVTGTATASINETDVVNGGKTIIITLTNGTWKAAGTGPIGSIADSQAIIDGLDSAQSEITGWNAEVRDVETHSIITRTSDTVCTITLSSTLSYDITAQETITVTVPAAALDTGTGPVTATPTFTVSADGAAGATFLATRRRRLENSTNLIM